jgi:hypothetical protein
MRWISYSLLPTFRRERELKLFRDMMAFPMNDAAGPVSVRAGWGECWNL